jgi:hypothetical protein
MIPVILGPSKNQQQQQQLDVVILRDGNPIDIPPIGNV